MLQTSTAQLFLDMLAVKINNIDLRALLDILFLSLPPSHPVCLPICTHAATQKQVYFYISEFY